LASGAAFKEKKRNARRCTLVAAEGGKPGVNIQLFSRSRRVGRGSKEERKGGKRGEPSPKRAGMENAKKRGTCANDLSFFAKEGKGLSPSPGRSQGHT